MSASERFGAVVALAVALFGCGTADAPSAPKPVLAASSAPPRIDDTARAAPATSSSSSASAATQIRYVALGDSFTIGTGSTPDDAFPARLTHAWSSCDVHLANLGVNGFTSADVLRVEVPRLGEFAPTFVTFAAGANDIVHGIPEASYRAVVARVFAAIRAAGVPPSHTIALPQPDWSLSPAAASFGDPAELASRIERYNAILAEEAKTAGARYVDLFPLLHDLATKHEVADDGLHPSKHAHDVWGNALARELGACTSYGP